MPHTPAILLAVQAAPTLLGHLREVWAYVTLGASAIVTEEVAPLLGGFAAEEGHLGFTRAVLAVAIGVWTMTAVLYFVGRWRAAWVRLKLRGAPDVVRKLMTAMRWSPWRTTFIARFAFGARIALPLACGAAHMRPAVFLAGSAIASLVWATLFTMLGWFFGESAVLLVGHVRRYEDELALVLIALGVAAFLWLHKRQKARRARPPAEPRANQEGDR